MVDPNPTPGPFIPPQSSAQVTSEAAMTGGVDRQHGSATFDPFASTYTTPNTQYNQYAQGYHQQAVQAPAGASPYGMPSGFPQYYDAQGYSIGSRPYHPAVHQASATSASLLPGFLYDSAKGAWYNAPSFAPAAAPPPTSSLDALAILPAFTAILERFSASIEANALAVTESQKQIGALQAQIANEKSVIAPRLHAGGKNFNKPAPARYSECDPCDEDEYYEGESYVSELNLKPLHSDLSLIHI